jgi:tRNA U54 and U55 pseudouridine synthase Pus10
MLSENSVTNIIKPLQDGQSQAHKASEAMGVSEAAQQLLSTRRTLQRITLHQDTPVRVLHRRASKVHDVCIGATITVRQRGGPAGESVFFAHWLPVTGKQLFSALLGR